MVYKKGFNNAFQQETINQTINLGDINQAQLEDKILSTLGYLSAEEEDFKKYDEQIQEIIKKGDKSEPKINIFADENKLAIFKESLKEIESTGKCDFSNNTKFELLGGEAYLEGLHELYNLEGWDNLAKLVDKSYKAMETLQIMRVLSSAYSGEIDLDNTSKLRLQRQLDNILATKNEILNWSPNLAKMLILESQKAKVSHRFMKTGYKTLDEAIGGGLEVDNLYVIAARPAVGKTALLVNLANNISKLKIDENLNETDEKTSTLDIVHNRFKAGVFSLEMSENQIAERLMSIETGIQTRDVKNPNELEQALLLKWQYLQNQQHFGFYINDYSRINISTIENVLSEAVENGQPFSVLFIDYLQLLNRDMKNSDRERISSASRGLKELARLYHCAIVTLAQFNRSADNRNFEGNVELNLSMIKGSGSIEQDADVVMFLSRDDFYDDNLGDNNSSLSEVSLQLAKNRFGSSGEIKLNYYKSTQIMQEKENQNLSNPILPNKQMSSKITKKGDSVKVDFWQ